MQKEGAQRQGKYQRLFSREQLGILDYKPLVQANQFEYVYEPNDDTFLILSTLKHELNSMQFHTNMFLCEVGSGSGILSANLHHWLKQAGKQPLIHLSIDINMDASILSQKYYRQYALEIEQVNGSLFNSFIFPKGIGRARPDVIIFNPPYVPVQQQQLDNEQKYLKEKLRFVRESKKSIREKQLNMIAYSYMGGLDGLAVTRKFLRQISWDCKIYFIVMGEEGLDQITKEIHDSTALNQQAKFQKDITLMQYAQFYNQHLYVLRLNLKVI